MSDYKASAAAVQAILEARKRAAIEGVVEVRAIPALPPVKGHPVTPVDLQTISLHAQSIPSLTAPVEGAELPVVPAPQPKVSDDDVSAFLAAQLPALVQAARDLVTPPFNFSEVVGLGTAVSEAVALGLPQIKGLEARALVVVVVRYVWRTHATPLLPAYIRPLANILEGLIIAGIEAGYRLVVKPKK